MKIDFSWSREHFAILPAGTPVAPMAGLSAFARDISQEVKTDPMTVLLTTDDGRRHSLY